MSATSRTFAVGVAPILIMFSVVGLFDRTGPSPTTQQVRLANHVNETDKLPSWSEGAGITIDDNITKPKESVSHLRCNEVNLDISRPHDRNLGEERVLVLGLCKAGTTSLHAFFESVGYRACHYACGWNGTDGNKRDIGRCMQNAIADGMPPMKSCGNFQVYSDLNQVRPDEKQGCYFPQIQALEELHEEDPNSTIILNMRHPDNWVTSVQKWWALAKTLPRCKLGPVSGNSTDLKAWYCDHVQRIRTFAANHPSHTYVEVDIEAPGTGQRLADLFGVNVSHWGHKKNNPFTARKKKRVPVMEEKNGNVG